MLGTLQVDDTGVDVTPVRPKQRAVLAMLLLHAGETVSVDELLDALWGDRQPETALTALHGHISSLRKRLGADRIQTNPPGYLFRLLEGDELDIRRFESFISRASKLDLVARSEPLRDALGLFRGQPLADFRFDEFARHDAARLAEVRLTAIEQVIEAELEIGRYAEAIPELERLVSDQPLRERARSLLMLALYRVGRQADALHVAQEARLILADELGIEPGPALQRLEQQILNQDPQLAAPDLVASAPRRRYPILPSVIATFLSAGTESPRRQVPRPAEFGTNVMPDARELLLPLAERYGGLEVSVEDGLTFVFGRVGDAVESAAGMQRVTHGHGVRIRIGIHSAEVVSADEPYSGAGVRGAAHLRAAAHDGQILLSQASRDLLRQAPLDHAEVRDLGEHRLQDLGPPQRLYQLANSAGDDDFPPPRGVETAPTNLPVQLTSLIGRDREIGEVVATFSDPEVRLVTLVGTAGAGKTRLALHCGAEMLKILPNGVWFVDLAPLSDPDLVLPTIARTLGVQETVAQPIEAALRRRLHGQQLLLVIDNFEHLLPAAPKVAAVTATEPGVRLLVTSRAPLGLAGEVVREVPPLETPAAHADLEHLRQVESVVLFASRARTVRSDFAVRPENAAAVASICLALDGLPLAIELAASRVAVLPPPVLFERLRRHLKVLSAGGRAGTDRHRTLVAAIDWSHDLLDPGEQALFMRLSVFSAGCTLEAAEDICGVGVEVIDGLASLVDQSLIRLEGTNELPRFAMLETIREYAGDHLEASGEADDLRLRHADHFLGVVEEAEPHLRGSPAEWLDRLEGEHDNLRAALDRLLAADEIQRALRMAGALWRFWYLGGYLTEGRRRLEETLERDNSQSVARGKALIGAAVMAVNSGDVEAAMARSEEGLALHDRLGEAWGSAYSRFMLGAAVRGAGDLERARQLHEQSIGEFRELADEHSALLVNRNLAGIYEDMGERERARALYEDNLRRARATDNQRIQASTLGELATIAYEEGRIQDALWMLKDSMRIHHGLGDHLDAAVDLSRSARVLALAGGAGTAVQILSSLESIGQDIGVRRSSLAEMNKETLSAVRRQLDAAAFAGAWQQGRDLTLDQAVALAITALE